jgi:hypothetical protein
VRKKKFEGYQVGQFDAEFQRYVNMMANYRQGEYNALITADFKLDEVSHFRPRSD